MAATTGPTPNSSVRVVPLAATGGLDAALGPAHLGVEVAQITQVLEGQFLAGRLDGRRRSDVERLLGNERRSWSDGCDGLQPGLDTVAVVAATRRPPSKVRQDRSNFCVDEETFVFKPAVRAVWFAAVMAALLAVLDDPSPQLAVFALIVLISFVASIRARFVLRDGGLYRRGLLGWESDPAAV